MNETQWRASMPVRKSAEGALTEGNVYEGVRLDGSEEKLIPLVDHIAFHCKLARLRTRLLVVREAEGCVTLTWSRYAPAVFRGNRLLELVSGGQFIDLLTVQESRAA